MKYSRRLVKTLPTILIVAAAIAAVAVLAVAQWSSDNRNVPSVASVPDTKARGAEFIGYRHKGALRGERLSNGVRDLGGGLLTDENYGVTRFSRGGQYMLWLEQILEYDDEGVPTWEVKDVLIFDKLKTNQMFLYSYSSPCTDDGAENLDLIVMVEENRKRKTYKVLKAWKANVETERFEETSTGAIVCPYAAKY